MNDDRVFWYDRSIAHAFVRNGIIYIKREGQLFYHNDDAGTAIAVICSCGNDNFNLSYGSYEVRAHCPICNRSEVVYGE